MESIEIDGEKAWITSGGDFLWPYVVYFGHKDRTYVIGVDSEWSDLVNKDKALDFTHEFLSHFRFINE